MRDFLKRQLQILKPTSVADYMLLAWILGATAFSAYRYFT